MYLTINHFVVVLLELYIYVCIYMYKNVYYINNKGRNKLLSKHLQLNIVVNVVLFIVDVVLFADTQCKLLIFFIIFIKKFIYIYIFSNYFHC